MPHPPRTTQLFAGQIGTSGLTTVGTVPPGARWLVKYVSFVPSATNPGSGGVFVVHDGELSILTYELAMVSFEHYQYVELYGVLDEGDELIVQAASVVGGDAFVHIGGLVFEL